MTQKKDVVLSASTTTGNITLGNYIGAINNWKEMLDTYETFFMVANLHSITTHQDPSELKLRTESFFAQYIAMGLDPEKCTLFVQSQVPQHAELQWILSCMVPLGHLNRMTQFKDKIQGQKSVQAGLLMYPVLMAADILLYQAKYVPVGEDQKQHLELCRDIVVFFENTYGPLFQMPNPLIPKVGARIMALTDPEKKMSKSDSDPNSYISILDEAKIIEKKIKKAVTDSGSRVYFDESSQGMANLLTIYSILHKKSFEQIEEEFSGKMYGHFKLALAEVIIETFRPVQEKYLDLMKNRDYLSQLMASGAQKASARASLTLKEVYSRMGILCS